MSILFLPIKTETPREFLDSFGNPDKIIQHCPDDLENYSPEKVYGAIVEFGRKIHKLRMELELNVLVR